MSFTSTHLPPTPLPGLLELHSDRFFCLCSCINWRPFPTIIWHDLLKMLHESEPVTLLLWNCLMTCHWPEDEVLPCLPGLTGNFKNRAGALSLSPCYTLATQPLPYYVPVLYTIIPSAWNILILVFSSSSPVSLTPPAWLTPSQLSGFNVTISSGRPRLLSERFLCSLIQF